MTLTDKDREAVWMIRAAVDHLVRGGYRVVVDTMTDPEPHVYEDGFDVLADR